MKNARIWFALLVLVVVGSAQAAELSVKMVDKAPPAEVSDSIKSLLQPKAIQISNGDKTAYEFWLRKELPLTSAVASSAKALDSVSETTVLGVATVGQGHRDYKDNEIPAGTYTVRFGLQPQDGDHLGTADFLYFAVLIPAKTDTAPDTIKTYKAMVRASGKASATGHPLVLSLRPAPSAAGGEPKLTIPVAEHKAVEVSLPGKVEGANQTSAIQFELVIEGKYKG